MHKYSKNYESKNKYIKTKNIKNKAKMLQPYYILRYIILKRKSMKAYK